MLNRLHLCGLQDSFVLPNLCKRTDYKNVNEGIRIFGILSLLVVIKSYS